MIDLQTMLDWIRKYQHEHYKKMFDDDTILNDDDIILWAVTALYKRLKEEGES